MFNRYIVVPLVVWAITQFAKFVLAAAKGRVDFRYLYASGGMPSVHSAVVISLAVTAFLVDGAHSSIFGLTIIFAAIVMYDSFGVRRSAGEQAVAINNILDNMGAENQARPPQHLREILGHNPLEVTVGALVGLILGCILNYDKIGAIVDFITTNITLKYIYALAVIAILLIVGGILTRSWLRRTYSKLPQALAAAKTTSWSAWVIGLLGLILAFVQYEKVQVATWALWDVLYLVIILTTGGLLYKRYAKVLPVALESYKIDQDKQKWFEGPNKKRRAKAGHNKKR